MERDREKNEKISQFSRYYSFRVAAAAAAAVTKVF
jgi:hypothetical protein